MWQQVLSYFANNRASYLSALGSHVAISLTALAFAVAIGVPAGILVVHSRAAQRVVLPLFQTLRIIPSLAVLLLLIPLLGTGAKPAVVALVLLGMPPILMNTVAGLRDVPGFMLETADGLGMTAAQSWYRVRLPLALPMVATGVKTALVEIIASATLAAKIGAGGLGELIFTGLGLNRADLLLVGGLSVALLSLLAGLALGLVDRLLFRYRTVGTTKH